MPIIPKILSTISFGRQTIIRHLSCAYAIVLLFPLLIGTTTTPNSYDGSQTPATPQNFKPVEMSHLIMNGTTVVSSGSTGESLLPIASDSSSLQAITTTNLYSNVQAQKFRVNVSNICEKNQMRATVRINKPFYGLIHTKDKRRRHACSLDGNGELSYSMEISYTLNPSDPSHCGVVSHQLQPPRQHPNQTAATSNNNAPTINQRPQLTLSVVLVVRLHKSIEFSDDRYFLLSCANRCTKPDCSAETTSKLISTPDHLLAGKASPRNAGAFATDESVESPIINRTNSNNNNWKFAPEQATLNKSERQHYASWPTEKCDIMLDMKFQWLVKLCWVLAILVTVMLCAALYLCLSASHSNRKRLKRHRDKRSLVGVTNMGAGGSSSCSGSSSNGSSNKVNSSKHVIYPQPPPQQQQQQTADPSWPAAQMSNPAENDHHLYLAAKQQQQQRQLVLANLNIMAAAAAAAANNERQHQQMILGRSGVEPFLGGGQQQPPEATSAVAARVRRRRSIGGSSAALGGRQAATDDRSTYNRRATLSASQRSKSRSQTTIHYDQGQDPFKTVPFNYVSSNNNGYLSDSGNDSNQRVYLAQDFVGTEVYGMPTTTSRAAPSLQQDPRMQTFASNHSFSESNMSLPKEMATSTRMRPSNDNTMTREDNLLLERAAAAAWTNNFKPTFVPPPQVDTVQGSKGFITSARDQPQPPTQQQQPSSQFDPQNSRQLINLIQHKHRQQIEQANRTAASMQSSAVSEMLAEIQQRQQPPSALNQHRVNQMSALSRPPWR